MTAVRETGSFRDPNGSIWHVDGRVIRTLNETALQNYLFAEKTGLFDCTFKHGRLVPTKLIDSFDFGQPQGDVSAQKVLEHQKIPFISYPYEWSFYQLKEAALFQLELLKEALERGVMLSDATAYNMQFIGTTPYFIDTLSFRPYQTGEIWAGYKQFCEQYLNPLLLEYYTGVRPNNWYRGSLEGISANDLRKVLPFRKKLSPKVFAHIVLPSMLQKKANKQDLQKLAATETRQSLPKAQLTNICTSLYTWISSLKLPDDGKSEWSSYEKAHSYNDEEYAAKSAFIADIVNKLSPETVWDIGCNTGNFAQICLENGAKQAIGFDFDIQTVGIAYRRAKEEDRNFLPLYQDLANPSPGNGWAGRERQSFADRSNADFVIALALIHHLCIGRNLPLSYFAEWLVSLSSHGVVEFVPKNDPMVQELLKNREDIFPDYTLDAFLAELKRYTKVLKLETITNNDRTLIFYGDDKK